jgi:hypothetical protein
MQRFMGLVAIITLGGLVGCVNLSAPETVHVGPGGGAKQHIKEKDAYRIARELVRSKGMNPDEYELQDRKSTDGWWILFDHTVHGYRLGYPYHLAVLVSGDGKAVLYRSE